MDLNEIVTSIADSLKRMADSLESIAVMNQQALIGITEGTAAGVVPAAPQEDKPKKQTRGKGKKGKAAEEKKEEKPSEPAKEEDGLFDEEEADTQTHEVTRETLLDEIRQTVKVIGKDRVVDDILKKYNFVDHTSQINPSNFAEIVQKLQAARKKG